MPETLSGQLALHCKGPLGPRHNQGAQDRIPVHAITGKEPLQLTFTEKEAEAQK